MGLNDSRLVVVIVQSNGDRVGVRKGGEMSLSGKARKKQ